MRFVILTVGACLTVYGLLCVFCRRNEPVFDDQLELTHERKAMLIEAERLQERYL